MKTLVPALRVRAIQLLTILWAIVALSPIGRSATVADLAGIYEGAWTNLTFGSTGKAVIEIQVTPPTAAMRFDMDGFVFGSFNPPPITMPGTIVGDTVQIDNQGIGFFGDIRGLIDAAAGTFTASITNVPGGFIQQISASGTIRNGRMDLQYTVVFPSPASPTNPAHGVMGVARATPLSLKATPLPNGQVTLEWSGGKAPYQVQVRTALGAGSWINLGSPQNGNTLVVPAASQHQFFRVTGS